MTDEFDNDGTKRESKWDRIRAHQERARFTEEALKSQDGKKVELRLENDGPIIGEATLKYDPEARALTAEFRIDDPKVAEFLQGDPPSIFRRES